MTIKTQLASFEFDSPLMNASGVWCSDEKELREMDGSKAATFVTKTATLEERPGNAFPRVHNFDGNSINSSGLPNLGIDYYLETTEELQKENPDKTYFLSATELSEERIYEILKKIDASSFEGVVELNLSCPNVEGKPQVAYDFETTDRILAEVSGFLNKPFGIKLPPYFDMSHFDQIASIIKKYPITYVNSINSIGNGLVLEDETVSIKPKNGFGGLGGPIIKQTALANVHALHQRLGDQTAIIGTGGVQNGRDVFEHILCGASMVQVGTSLLQEGTDIFDRLEKELLAIMQEKNYESLEDFRGKVNYLSE